MKMWCSWKVHFYGLLMLGLVSCQNGDANPVVEGSGTGSGEEQIATTTWISSTKRLSTTVKPEDTTTDAGSGDDEDTNTTKTVTPFTTTVRPTTRPTDDEDGSGSGSGVNEKYTPEPVITVAGVTTTSRPEDTTESSDDVTTESSTGISTRRKIDKDTKKFTPGTTMETTTTESNFIENGISTAEPKTEGASQPWNEIEIINSPTTKTNQPTRSRTTTEMSNSADKKDKRTRGGENETEDDINGNIAKQVGREKGSDPSLYIKIGIIVGAVLGAVLIVYIIVLLVHRLRKKDEGSYSLEEPITGYVKQEPGSPVSGKEYFA
ncbi:syndecan-2-like [Rhopilema esculentum]|uniref:syndecan-2-like n=1 Tax=Rhopilema esculentum TaxID=499914 RepID=UPI0031DE6453|eukprot:gene8587-14597_t